MNFDPEGAYVPGIPLGSASDKFLVHLVHFFHFPIPGFLSENISSPSIMWSFEWITSHKTTGDEG